MTHTDYITEEFTVEDIPTCSRGAFPYDRVLHTLSLLAMTKSISFLQTEIKTNHIAYLRKQAQLRNLGMLKTAKKDGKVYLWINKM